MSGGVLVKLFSMVVPGRDANMHTQQRSKDGECKTSGGFERGFVVGANMFFCCIGSLPPEGFHMSFVA